MANLRVQIVGQPTVTDPGRDYITNVLWYSTNGATPAGVGDAIKAAFTASAGPYYTFANVWVKVYDHANPLHSPPVYQTQYSGSGSTSWGPRQVALCLSFYCGLNIRGKRGRIYVGPFAANLLSNVAPAGVMNMLQYVIGLMRLPGGPDVVHQLHHVKTDTFSPVTNYFVNNRWDTMRSRLGKETSRYVYP